MDHVITSVSKLIAHRVGNKLRDEPLKLSRSETELSDELAELLLGGYLKGILSTKNEHQFHHETELSLNEARHHANSFFSGEIDFVEASRRFATHLYTQSLHPNIRQGDLLVILFDRVPVGTKTFRAIGLFKSEVPDHYLTVQLGKDELNVVPSTGINPNMIDKGALILEGEDTVFALDRFGHRTKFWLDDFLRVKKSADPITCSKVMSFIAGKVAEKIENPIDRARYGESVAALCNEDEQFRSSSLSDLATTYIEEEEYRSMLSQAERRYGLDPSQELIAPSEKLNRTLAKKIFKFSLGHEVSLLIPSTLRLDDFHVEDLGGGALQFTIRLRGQGERGRF
ncbi:MAG: nucleoid-associated protein [Betaproteobacteria bacterium]|nr:nucleoid-associated protein [Betaproteobacteria bacterium]